MYSRSLSGTHKTRYRKILRGHHDVGVYFIQDMWGKAMHMHSIDCPVLQMPKDHGKVSKKAACGMLCR